MKENICTIPINDIFKISDGCPICNMYNMLEEQYVEFITGSAMMAPDVRVVTNKKGFCHHHYEKMVKHGPRLSNALLLQTHLDEIRNTVFDEKANTILSKATLEYIDKLSSSCYVCDRIEHDIIHLLKTVFAQYGIDEEFRQLYKNQKYLCLNHYAFIMKNLTKKSIDKKYLSEFCDVTTSLCKNYINSLYDDVTKFTTMFDYRNAGKDFENSKDSIERSVKFLTSKDIT